jgi:hypothetical protein
VRRGLEKKNYILEKRSKKRDKLEEIFFMRKNIYSFEKSNRNVFRFMFSLCFLWTVSASNALKNILNMTSSQEFNLKFRFSIHHQNPFF